MTSQQIDVPSASGDGHGRIGPYRLLRVLGEGGMGIVYEAEELGPVRRRVALKLIKPGFASRASTARIEAERQALAVMNHPAIASVFAAGATEEGQPYFAMELASGSQLTEYCDAHRLTVRERLQIFLEICRGAQHAHQKGVIHRDLKPSNVLVVEQEGGPQPKIIDFGIAKALGQQLTESTLVTQQGQTLGTAAYMCPEQAGATGLDVDTRADIYSLGVILYELLVGQLPLNPSSVGIYVFIASLATGQINPPAPSEKLGVDMRESTLIAHNRKSDPQRLRREIRGDLDRIVLKAIEPDRARRYETVNALAEDIQRYLANEPILARPPSTGYRLRKFARRHRTVAIAGGLTAAALLLGSASTTVGMLRATRAERVAAEEAAAAQQVAEFLVEIFKEPDPYQTRRTDDVSAREVLDRGVQRVRKELAAQPLLRGRIMHTMGTSYANLGDYLRAREMLEEVLTSRERLHGPDHPDVASTLNDLGGVALATGNFSQAEAHYRRALAIGERLQPRNPPIIAAALSGLAGIRVRQGLYPQAESLYLGAKILGAEFRGADDATPTRVLDGLAVVYYYQGRYAEAEPLMRELLETQERTLGPDHPRVASTLNNLGGVTFDLGRYGEALALYERALAILERRLDATHPDIALALTNIGEAHWKLKRYSEAERVLRRASTIDHPTRASTLNGLAGVLRDQGRYAEAEPLYREAIALRERARHPRLKGTLGDYAQLLRATGRTREAAELEARAAQLR